MLSCFFFFAFSSGARLLISTSRWENRLELRTPPLFACNGWISAKGTLESDGASLASLLISGTTDTEADLMSEMALLGPRDWLRRSRSSVKTRCRLRRGLTGTGRLVAAPGRDKTFEVLADLDSFGLAGETTTGPPSLRLIPAQRSGRRAAKLLCVRPELAILKQTYNGTTTSTQKSLRMLSAGTGAVVASPDF
jgi:hypothetical protein